MSEKHDVEVWTSLAWPPSYFPECSCGWTDAGHRTELEALVAADVHLSGAKGEEQPGTP